jgi:general stress protein 26
MSEDEFRELSKTLLETAWPAYLTTIDAEGYPQTRAMFNLRNKKWFPKLIPFFEKHGELTIIFSTNTSSTKINDIKTNSRVSVYYCDPESWKGVMFGGNIEVVDDIGIKKELWHDDWDKYYPKGHDDPDHTVLRLSPKIAKGWAGSMTFNLKLGDTQ